MHGANPQIAPNVSAALANARRFLGEEPQRAAEAARELLSVSPGIPEAYRILGAALRRLGDDEAANNAELNAIALSVRDPEMLRAGQALVENDLPTAEAILRPRLHKSPTDVAAIRMMAELAARVGRPRDSEHLLRRALELAPGWDAARVNLATLLYRQNRWTDALEELAAIEAEEDDGRHSLKAALLGRIGAYEEAIRLYRAVLEKHPGRPPLWMSVGHMLKTVGDVGGAVDAYRRALSIDPKFGEGWWSLANLKTFHFSDEDIAAMRAALSLRDLDEKHRLHVHFALGKALEDRGDDEGAFANYAGGNSIRAAQVRYDPQALRNQVDETVALFTPEFVAARAGLGAPAPDPIFIVGMPRAGSTLVEQILASHSQVEGTAELPDIPRLVKRLNADGRYPRVLERLQPDELRRLGEDYLESTRVHRNSGRPLFSDKLPNNWAHIGLIRLILPNAKIVDARRHPLACGFSNFKQLYARGQNFSYDLEHLGRYYADYVRLMEHFDRVMPGTINRVINERLVADPEGEIRALLSGLGLPFEDSCLRFHETNRAIATPSAEQVRRPISKEGIDRWRRFEPWLAPLKAGLGEALDRWDDAPAQ